MKRNQIQSSVICFITIVAMMLMMCFDVHSQPTYEDMKKTNVSIEMQMFTFASGLRPGENGLPNGNGTELLASQGCGSGFIVKNDGTILTNYHVAQRLMNARAIFEDGSYYDIKHIKVYDYANDIAVLKINSTKEFPTVKLGNSDAVNVMNRVLAVGNSRCQQLAVSEGIINQINVDDYDKRWNFRHSAVLAPGNSGGALYGGDEVIGINRAIIQGLNINFAIPINLAKNLLTEEYDRKILFRDAFPNDVQQISSKAVLLDSLSGTAPAASGDEPGIWEYTYPLYPLVDYILSFKAEQGQDLYLIVSNPLDTQKSLRGFSDMRNTEYELLYLEGKKYEEVKIWVCNRFGTPVNYALDIHRIGW